MTCAPFLATHMLKQLANDEEMRFPRGAAAERYLRRRRADGCRQPGGGTYDSAPADIAAVGGFPLRKWAANADELLEGIPSAHRQQ